MHIKHTRNQGLLPHPRKCVSIVSCPIISKANLCTGPPLNYSVLPNKGRSALTARQLLNLIMMGSSFHSAFKKMLKCLTKINPIDSFTVFHSDSLMLFCSYLFTQFIRMLHSCISLNVAGGQFTSLRTAKMQFQLKIHFLGKYILRTNEMLHEFTIQIEKVTELLQAIIWGMGPEGKKSYGFLLVLTWKQLVVRSFLGLSLYAVKMLSCPIGDID